MTFATLTYTLFRIAWFTWCAAVLYVFFCDMSKSAPGLVGRWEKPDLLAPLVKWDILGELWAERLYLVWDIAYMLTVILLLAMGA